MTELKYSKRKQTRNKIIDKSDFKPYIGKESDLQKACEQYLNLMNVDYIRIPDALYRAVFGKYAKIEARDRVRISNYLKGKPDLTILSPDGRYLCIELKVGKNKTSQGQNNFAKRIPVTICRSFDHFKQLVDNFIERKQHGITS